MATRSAIIMKDGDTYKGIYCHWDGYPSGVGEILKHHYIDTGKVRELISLGDVSSLRENVHPSSGSNHSFNDPEDNVTVAYKRDRGEENTEAISGPTWRAVANQIDHTYIYVFENGRWIIFLDY